ncbi:Piwi, PAZ, and/or DUF1785 domain containing protein [Asbolus verrucosus]|uniref:Piwi, PAZ, and/or DUF1785 domain containing protein n=1 Tax=Asbolus verrucosus TaxID=1661398 RepID=A0A482VG33_ASBVE|nr:Piwi, PAZ, and/or DUF1785 domain containing protein [Asbolus verrucosus]
MLPHRKKCFEKEKVKPKLLLRTNENQNQINQARVHQPLKNKSRRKAHNRSNRKVHVSKNSQKLHSSREARRRKEPLNNSTRSLSNSNKREDRPNNNGHRSNSRLKVFHNSRCREVLVHHDNSHRVIFLNFSSNHRRNNLRRLSRFGRLHLSKGNHPKAHNTRCDPLSSHQDQVGVSKPNHNFSSLGDHLQEWFNSVPRVSYNRNSTDRGHHKNRRDEGLHNSSNNRDTGLHNSSNNRDTGLHNNNSSSSSSRGKSPNSSNNNNRDMGPHNNSNNNNNNNNNNRGKGLHSNNNNNRDKDLHNSNSNDKVHSKEQSPPFGGRGDCLKQMALVKSGTRGRKITVESNHLALNVGTLMTAVHYDVSITPDTPKLLLRDVMNLFGQKHYPNRHPAFDGRKNLYSPTKLPFGVTDSISDVIKVEGENRPKEFKVEIKFARMVDLSPLHDMLKTKTSPQDALQCLDIVLRNAPSNTCITAGRCFFTPPTGEIIDLGDGMEMYYGFYQSAIRGWKPLLNVDVAHKAFPKAIQVLDLICDLGTNYRFEMRREHLVQPLNDSIQRNLEKFLKTLKVKYEITNQSGSKRIYRVNGLGEAPSRAQFKLEDGSQTTVENYFLNVKRCRLKYPHLPTLWVGARDRDSKILLPLEFCSVMESQTINRKMNENQTSAMIKKSATSTTVRKSKIMDSLQKARYNNDPCIREFGFSVNNQFERLEARILTPPSLLYAGNTTVTPSKGVWRVDRGRFLIGATIKKWTIACVTRQPCRVEQLAESIFKMAGSNGMQMASKATPPFVHVSGRQTVRDITDYFRTKQDFDLIFVVVPNSGPQYSFVKQAAELNVGCLTQCIKERTLNKLNTQTVVNILLKVNSKMNGTNHAFNTPSRPPIMNRPCMIMGADVTHPSPDAKDIPSVAAVTASHDPKAFQYNICWRLQPPKVEIIEDLCNITMEQLIFFYKKTGYKPERIVFFRDGVSEGQFREVQRAEITAIQQACRRIQAEGYQPAITFLVVQKRHHTRLFPTSDHDTEDRNYNVPAGTCVDTLITNPTMQDFYLVSHASIQGVAKPTKYCTLWDDNNMTNDDIEELTYHLCHMFTRCNRSVSYPAPTYYAHLAAARAKVYIENDKLNMDELKKHQETYQIKECISKDKPMFFV